MKFSELHRRDDLCKKGQTVMYYGPDYGVVVKVGRRWWASNDQRRELIGVESKEKLARPTVGPFSTAKEAHTAYESAREKINGSAGT